MDVIFFDMNNEEVKIGDFLLNIQTDYELRADDIQYNEESEMYELVSSIFKKEDSELIDTGFKALLNQEILSMYYYIKS